MGPPHPRRDGQVPGMPWCCPAVAEGRQHGSGQPHQSPCSTPSPELALFSPPLFYPGREKAAGDPGRQHGATGCPTKGFLKDEVRNTGLGGEQTRTCDHGDTGRRGAWGWVPQGGCAGWAGRCPARPPPSPCATLFARALSPALGVVTLSPALGATAAAGPLPNTTPVRGRL